MSDNNILQNELDMLNLKVKEAIEKRKLWMDQHMQEFADYKIGEELFFIEKGSSAGIIREMYRLHENDQRFDDSMSINYRFTNGDNTSRHGGAFLFCNKQELIERKKRELNSLLGE